MNWIDNTKTFIDVVDLRNFSKAAEKGNTSAAAVSRKVSWLEEQLGVSLLHRTTRVIQLTEEGKLFYQQGKAMLAMLNDIKAELSQQQTALQGPLIVTAPYSFGNSLLATKAIPGFLYRHPKVELNLDLSNTRHDLIGMGIDVAFRSDKQPPSGYASTLLYTLQVGIYASPDYLKKYGTPKQPQDLTSHNCLIHKNLGNREWLFHNAQKQTVNGTVHSNATHLLVTLARQGLGLVRTMQHNVATAVARGELIPLMNKYWSKPLAMHIVYRDSRTAPKRVTEFVEHIIKLSKKDFLLGDVSAESPPS